MMVLEMKETYSRENIYDDSKERIMKNKIWGLVIIFCCCLVSISFAQETNFTLAAQDSPALVQTRVDVSIEKNSILTFQADNPLLQGKITMRVVEKVTLLSGDYAGWGYAYLEYNTGKLAGSLFYVFHNDEGRGMLTGDVVGVAQQLSSLENNMVWKVAILEGTDTRATIDLTFDSYKPGKIDQFQDIWMPVVPSFTLSSNGYSQETAVLLLPAPDGDPHNVRNYKGAGLEFGTYQAGTGSGTFWSFLDNTELVDPPFFHTRFGTRDGVLAGTGEIVFLNGAVGNTTANLSTLLTD